MNITIVYILVSADDVENYYNNRVCKYVKIGQTNLFTEELNLDDAIEQALGRCKQSSSTYIPIDNVVVNVFAFANSNGINIDNAIRTCIPDDKKKFLFKKYSTSTGCGTEFCYNITKNDIMRAIKEYSYDINDVFHDFNINSMSIEIAQESSTSDIDTQSIKSNITGVINNAYIKFADTNKNKIQLGSTWTDTDFLIQYGPRKQYIEHIETKTQFSLANKTLNEITDTIVECVKKYKLSYLTAA